MDSLDGIYIIQKFEYIEAFLDGYESPNKYYVYALDSSGNKTGKVLLKCKEKTDFCQRNCLSQECRGINMKVKNLMSQNEDTVLELTKPCNCTFACFNRPEMEVLLVENRQNQHLGKVTDPWDCFNHGFKVYDSNNKLSYKVVAGCMQLGLCCNCPFDSCEEVDFEVIDRDGIRQEDLRKVGKGCLQNSMGDADNFSVPFPKNATWEEKVLLLTVALMIDYRMFEETSKRNK